METDELSFFKGIFIGLLLGALFWAAIWVAATFVGRAHAHDRWADGSPVDTETKRWCCGDAEAHVLDPSRVHVRSDGSVVIDGMDNPVPQDRVLPSVDGQIWGFWAPGVGSNAYIRCLFYSGGV